jgi:glucose-1-phosphate cytidylyltransferase
LLHNIGKEDFCFTYGDGVGDINIKDLIKYHKTRGTLATVTSVRPPGRFGSLDIERGKITAFKEKP